MTILRLYLSLSLHLHISILRQNAYDFVHDGASSKTRHHRIVFRGIVHNAVDGHGFGSVLLLNVALQNGIIDGIAHRLRHHHIPTMRPELRYRRGEEWHMEGSLMEMGMGSVWFSNGWDI